MGEAKSIQERQGGKPAPSVWRSAERYSNGSLMTARVVLPADLDGLGLVAYPLLAAKTNAVLRGSSQEKSNPLLTTTATHWLIAGLGCSFGGGP